MSDKILKALMQLFAIIANSERLTGHGRSIVELFLKQQLSQSSVPRYLQFFDEYLEVLRGRDKTGREKKRVSVNSVKVLRICTDINHELNQQQKYVVLIRLLEFAYSSSEDITEQELEFLSTVAEVFNISKDDYDSCLILVSSKSPGTVADSQHFISLSSTEPASSGLTKHIVNKGFQGTAIFLYFESTGILFMRYFGDDTVKCNGQGCIPGQVYVISPGTVIRGTRSNPVYYNDIIRSFLKDQLPEPILFTAESLEYEFRNGKKGLHDFSFEATSGEMIGIMGGSGAGKSTLLNLLNGNYTPSAGKVKVNGISIHDEGTLLEGVVGYVPQDDLLIDDLTVYQNLFYNSKLCFGDLDNSSIDKLVGETLVSLGLWEIRDLKVGNVFNKTISGGQRKRLNIALELVRKPAVLFVDEPTSGLSSMDSENVMDLLKELSVSGKLIFVVIHQPSSDIFKLFDQLIILDLGGYPVYFGNPTDSLSYFKSYSGHADAEINECIECGNINPDLVFNILESKVLDEYGNITQNRKITPKEWYEHYVKTKVSNDFDSKQHNRPDVNYNKPSRLRQLQVFFTRDVLSKLKNTQYMLINFLEAPLLAFILAYFLRYFDPSGEYIYSENMNMPAYLFMCVIVALFMGLTVSAEEIIRDRKIQARESFLNLSRSSYLFSKVAILFMLSAIQTLSFVLIGNAILGIHGMNQYYFLILFSVSCFSNMLGLNISSAFNSAVTIYILIPFLIIPQIILSGVIVSFDKLNPNVTSQEHVPLIGEVMASRWAFEALAVQQFTGNRYERNFFMNDKRMNEALFKKDFWAVHMSDLLDSIKTYEASGSGARSLLFINEFTKEKASGMPLKLDVDAQNILTQRPTNWHTQLKSEIENIRQYYIGEYKTARQKKDDIVVALEKQIGAKGLTMLKKQNANESLTELVNNSGDFNYMITYNDEYYRRFRPIYMNGSSNGFLRAPFYVSRKNVFGNFYNTYWVNMGVIWMMSLMLFLTLYFDLLKKGIHGLERVSEKIPALKVKRR